MKGFFSGVSLPVTNGPRVPHSPQCGKCGLLNGCSSPKMPVDGKGRRKILVVGEAPGRNEDEQGRPFVGKAGQRLQRECEGVGLDLFKDCWVTNSLRCRLPNNRKPTPKEIDYCRPYLVRTIEEYRPEVIIPLGDSAVRSLLGLVWDEDVGGIGRWVGWNIPCQKFNAWVCPNWHPSYLERSEGDRDDPLLGLLFHKYLKRAVKKQGRPWDVLPDYKGQVITIMSPTQAAVNIDAMASAKMPLAFDFETDRLKPDHPESRIICCSLSDGVSSIAFPWHGDAVKAMSSLLHRVDVPKWGWNCQFESRWVKRKLGFWVKGWAFDGMLAAHTLDSRRKVSGLAFQAFVRLGLGNWDLGVRKFMKGKGGDNTPNTLAQADLTELCRYCALDSLTEWLVDEQLMRLLGMGK